MRARRSEVNDVICLAVPDGVDVDDKLSYMPRLEQMAWHSAYAQWPAHARVILAERNIDWLITNDPTKVEEFQPVHDCEQCRNGAKQARQYLQAHPGASVAMGNIHYVELWPDYALPPDLDETDRHYVIELLDTDRRLTVEQAIELVAYARRQQLATQNIPQDTQPTTQRPQWKEV